MSNNFTIGKNEKQQKVLFISYPCADNSYCPPISFTLQRGRYLFELWGARCGKICFGTEIAFGGYASGILSTSKPLSFQAHIGGVGSDAVCDYVNVNGGNNGGGKGGSAGSGGGGATDVRLDDTLQSRIIVAAGAGGGERKASGHGGGINGSINQNELCNHLLSSAKPGTQSVGGAAGYSPTYGSTESGRFGYGGSGVLPNDGAAGGGGGYFGGGSTPYLCSGAGGSSYISGHPQCRSVTGPDSVVTSNSPIHYSGIFFRSPKTITGNQQMPIPAFRTTIGTGNNGPGALKITFLELFSLQKTYYQSYYYFAVISLYICN